MTLTMIFAFMAATFSMGLLLGWLVWQFGGAAQTALENTKSEVSFWRQSFDQSRNELWAKEEEFEAVSAQKQEEFEALSAEKQRELEALSAEADGLREQLAAVKK